MSQNLDEQTIDQKLGALNDGERHLLRMTSLLQLPVPLAATELIAAEHWGLDGTAACQRLLGLGLWDRVADPADPERPACAVSDSVRRNLEPVAEEDAGHYAEQLLPRLQDAWPPDRSPPICDVQLCQVASFADDKGVFQARAEKALFHLYDTGQYSLGYALAKKTLEVLVAPGPEVVRLAAQLMTVNARSESDFQLCHDLYRRAIAARGEPEDRGSAKTYGDALRQQARLLVQLKEDEQAFEALQRAVELYTRFSMDCDRAIVLGDIARIKVARDAVDEALQLHRERLDVFQSLDEPGERAATLGDIARIKADQGELDEAQALGTEMLELHREMDDPEGIAAAQALLADVYLAQEKGKEAFEALTEALTILSKIGRVDGIATVGLKLGEILAAAGAHEQARPVLAHSRRAWETLGSREGMDAVDRIMQRIENPDD